MISVYFKLRVVQVPAVGLGATEHGQALSLNLAVVQLSLCQRPTGVLDRPTLLLVLPVHLVSLCDGGGYPLWPVVDILPCLLVGVVIHQH